MPYKLTNVSDYKGKTKHFNNVFAFIKNILTEKILPSDQNSN